MHDAEDKRSLADDPRFLDSLSELDRGLNPDVPPEPEAPRPTSASRPAAGAARPVAPAPAAAPASAPAPGEDPPADSPLLRLRAEARQKLTLPPSITAPFEALTVPESPAAEAPVAPPAEHETPHEGARPLLDLFPTPAARQSPSPLPSPRAAAPLPPAVAAPPRVAVAPPPTSRADVDEAAITVVQPSAAERAYGLTEKPFALSTDPRFFFHSTPHDAVSQQLLTAIRNRDGLVVLTGAMGSGKTTLCRVVMEQLDRRTLTSFVADPFLSGEELLRKVLADFGVVRDEGPRGGAATSRDLISTLRSFVESLASLEARAVVIVDEAQNVPPDVLEHVRTLCEAAEASSHLQVVLVGQPALAALLKQPANQKLQQRVTVRAELAPLPVEEIGSYVQHRLSIAGSARPHFDDTALARIHRLSNGVPRVVNLLCDRAIAHGFAASAATIDAARIDAAAEELDLGEPPSKMRRVGVRVAIVAWVLVCLLLGAGLAWVLRTTLAPGG